MLAFHLCGCRPRLLFQVISVCGRSTGSLLLPILSTCLNHLICFAYG